MRPCVAGRRLQRSPRLGQRQLVLAQSRNRRACIRGARSRQAANAMDRRGESDSWRRLRIRNGETGTSAVSGEA